MSLALSLSFSFSLISAPRARSHQDLVHFHKALRRHNKTWGRLVAIVLLVYTLLLVFNAVFALTARTHHGTPTAAPTAVPNATTTAAFEAYSSFSGASFSAAASASGTCQTSR
jgi:Mn2+/Fe2+ NRAMP family transporter